MKKILLILSLTLMPVVAFAGQDCWQLSQQRAKISDGTTCTCNDGNLRCVFKEDPQDAKPIVSETQYYYDNSVWTKKAEDAKPEELPCCYIPKNATNLDLRNCRICVEQSEPKSQ